VAEAARPKEATILETAFSQIIVQMHGVSTLRARRESLIWSPSRRAEVAITLDEGCVG
jgi:hypothetical protein